MAKSAILPQLVDKDKKKNDPERHLKLYHFLQNQPGGWLAVYCMLSSRSTRA
jgi:hypothetical protein